MSIGEFTYEHIYTNNAHEQLLTLLMSSYNTYV